MEWRGGGLGHVIILGVEGRRVGTCNNPVEWRGGGLGHVIICGVEGKRVGTCNNPWSGGEEGWDM